MASATAHPVVLYARVSQVRDDRSKSVDDQLAELRRWAQREGWPVVAEYRDSVSASKYANGKSRPGWEQAMTVVTSGRVKALLLWELSRATRDKLVSVALETACATNGVKLGYHGRLHDLATADGEFSVGLDALLAARESAMTSERTRRAAEHRAARGRPLAGVAYGYRRILDPRSGAAIGREIDPQTGPILAEIVRRLLEREPANAIARDLNERGVPAPIAGRCAPDCGCRNEHTRRPNPAWDGEHKTTSAQWTGGNLSKLAQRPVYAALPTHGGKILEGVEATWPALISVDDHYRLRELFGSPERDKWRNPSTLQHLGTGIYRCGRSGCDGRMRRVADPKGGAYGCRECFKVSRRQEPVDYLVEQTIIGRLSQPDILELLAGPDGDDARRQAASQVIRLRAEQADMQRLLGEGRLTPLDMAAWRQGWEPRIAAAEAAARPQAVPDAVTAMAGPDAALRWAQASVATRRAVLDALAVVTILPMHGVRGQPFEPASVRIEWRQ